MSGKPHDLVIIGGGPGGLTAGIYAARARMDVVLLDKGAYGGQMLTTSHIENYPGFPDGIGGFELADLMHRQAGNFGLTIQTTAVSSMVRENGLFALQTGSGSIFSHTVIVATGATPSKVGVPGEERLTGRGVSYCATCDGALYRERVVAVVGGGDSAVEEAIFLTRFATQVHVIHRRDELRAVPITAERARGNEKITFQWNTVLSEIRGRDQVEELVLKDVRSGEERTLPAEGVFIYVGIRPQSALVKDLLPLDNGGYIPVNLAMMTQVPGLFAIGDVRTQSIRQVASAVGDGATAAFNAYKYIQEKH